MPISATQSSLPGTLTLADLAAMLKSHPDCALKARWDRTMGYCARLDDWSGRTEAESRWHHTLEEAIASIVQQLAEAS
jgi:hypothetical protein